MLVALTFKSLTCCIYSLYRIVIALRYFEGVKGGMLKLNRKQD